jgi:hypothetical protein
LTEAAALIQAASELSGGKDDGSSPDINIRKIGLKAKKLQKEFLEDTFRAKSIGFYSQDETLQKIFLQDRFLQGELEEPVAKEIAESVSKDSNLLGFYERLLAIVQRLSNPFVGNSVLSGLDDSCVFPASRAHETDLVKKLFGTDPIPEGFNLMDELIRQVRDGELQLKPREDSGWYDYQTYSFEPFITPERCPEASKLQWGDKYLKYLEDMFVGLLAATRETHVKQLESLAAGCAATPTIVSPELSIEPLPEYYLRRAMSYQFIREALLEYFGEVVLTEEGVLHDLLDMESLLFGAYEICCEEIGLASQANMLSAREKLQSKSLTRQWLTNVKSDQDIAEDIRAMVPLFYDIGRGKTKVLAILGYSAVPLRIDYVSKPDIKIYQYGEEITSSANIQWSDQEATILKLETAELYVDKLLNREEFRAVCDEHKTKSGILNALAGEV